MVLPVHQAKSSVRSFMLDIVPLEVGRTMAGGQGSVQTGGPIGA
jgi:hypothetical protein